MNDSPPTLRIRNKKYTADRCQSLVLASKQGKIDLHALAREGYPGQKLHNNELPGVLSIGFWDAHESQNWGLTTHCNEGLEITFLETGNIAFNINNKTHTLKPGALTITRPWQPHALGIPNIGPGRLHWIILNVNAQRPHQRWNWPEWFVLMPDDLEKLTILLSHNETPTWKANVNITMCFQKIAKIIQTPSTTLQTSRLAVLINELFISLFDILVSKKISLQPELASAQRTVELFLESLKKDQHLLGQEWTSGKMAKHCKMGTTHFTGLCKKFTNMTPIQFLNYHRIEAAAKILTETNSPSITKIAFDLGFSSSQYFATVFKQIKGFSPKSFQKNNL